MAANVEPLKINLPASQYKQLTAIAKQQEVSVATLVNQAISEWLHKKEKHSANPHRPHQ